MSNPDPLDSDALDALLDATGGDPDFLAEMIDAYLTDTHDQLAAMDSALADGRPADLRRAAHSLKSNSATLGARELADLCRQLEDRAKAGELDSESAALIASIRAEYGRVHDVLQSTRAEL